MPDTTPVSNARSPLFKYLDREDFRAKPFAILGDNVLTYGALSEITARTARLFREAGIGIGDRIVICSEHELEVIMLYISALRSGVTAALIDHQASLDELQTLLRAADAKALFLDKRLVSRAAFEKDLLPGGKVFAMEGMASYPDLQGIARHVGSSPGTSYPRVLEQYEPLSLPQSIPDETSAFILFTSGTTSRPKGVEVSHRAVEMHFGTMHRQYDYNTESRIINGLPLHHSDGINHGPLNLVAAGATIFRTGPFAVQRLPEILNMIKQHRITHMITVPTVLALISRMGDEFSDAFRTSDFRFISSTAGPLDEKLWRSFEERFGTMIVNSYGLTETICEGFYCGPTPETRRIGTIGKPIDIDVRLIDNAGRDVPQGEMGEIILRGSCLMKGYYNAPEETAAVLRNGWLHTGDLAIQDSDGFYSIAGRKKNVIITGGLNVYPEDVSRTIARMPGIADVVTLGLPDKTWGERVVTCVVPAKPGGVSAEDVISYCRTHLSREKVPTEVFVVNDLPRGAAGKVALPQVRILINEIQAASPVAPVPAPDEMSESNITARVLDLAARSFKTTVGELSLDSEPGTTPGWTSIAHVDYILSLEAEFAISISPGDMLSITTIGDAIDLINRMCSTQKAQ